MKALHSLLFEKWFSLEPLEVLTHLPNHLLLLCFIVILALSKPIFSLCQKISLEKLLIQQDNKAVAIVFCSYTISVGIILQGVIHTEYLLNFSDVLSNIFWALFGWALLQITFWWNQYSLWTRDHHLKILLNENLSVACVMSGYLIANSLIIRSIISSDTISADFEGILLHPSIQALTQGYSINWFWNILLTLFYFIIAQTAFWLFSALYQKIVQFKLFEQIHENNIAVGIAYGGNIIAIAIILSAPLQVSNSLVFFFIWLVFGSALLLVLRFILDKILLPSRQLNLEIKEDHNWGIALFEASFSLLYAILLKALFV